MITNTGIYNDWTLHFKKAGNYAVRYDGMVLKVGDCFTGTQDSGIYIVSGFQVGFGMSEGRLFAVIAGTNNMVMDVMGIIKL